jgi:hypothetical protein
VRERAARGRRRHTGVLLVLVAAAVATAAAVDAFRGDAGEPANPSARGGERTALAGPFVPAAGALSGRLILAEGDSCRLAVLDFAAVSVERGGPETSCRLWAAPLADEALVARNAAGRRYELWVATTDGRPRALRNLGDAVGDPAWEPDGRRVAWCSPSGTTQVSGGLGLDLAVAGCGPRFAGDGSILTRDRQVRPRSLLRNGLPTLGEGELQRAFRDRGTPIELLGYDERRDGLLAVAVARFRPGRPDVALQLWRDRRLTAVVPLPLRTVPGIGPLGGVVTFSPDGSRIGVGYERGGFGFAVVDVRTGTTIRGPTAARGFAWSPDGRWLAVVARSEILVENADTGDVVYRLPLAARAIAWR